jgi:hypothetical protein
MPRQRKPLLKELFIMTWKKDKLQRVAIAKERKRVNRSITTRENKGANTQEPKKKREERIPL